MLSMDLPQISATRTAAPVRSNFARHEKKYDIDQAQMNAFIDSIADKLGYDEYARSSICSLYYDTPTDELINRSMEKPLYKEKLRVRSYGVPQAQSQVFVELKKKFKGIVYKRRVFCSYAAAKAFMAGAPYQQAIIMYPLDDPEKQQVSLSDHSLQIAAEIRACCERHPNLRPAMVIVTQRVSLRSTDESDIRITLDYDAVWRTNACDLAAGMEGEPLIDEDHAIMEIKCGGAYPLWLVDALNAVQAYPKSCSKYGRAYTAWCAEGGAAPAVAEHQRARQRQADICGSFGAIETVSGTMADGATPVSARTARPAIPVSPEIPAAAVIADAAEPADTMRPAKHPSALGFATRSSRKAPRHAKPTTRKPSRSASTSASGKPSRSASPLKEKEEYCA